MKKKKYHKHDGIKGLHPISQKHRNLPVICFDKFHEEEQESELDNIKIDYKVILGIFGLIIMFLYTYSSIAIIKNSDIVSCGKNKNVCPEGYEPKEIQSFGLCAECVKIVETTNNFNYNFTDTIIGFCEKDYGCKC